jgi:hypothetical protein
MQLESAAPGARPNRWSWPEQDLASIATSLLTGLPLSELMGLNLSERSTAGPANGTSKVMGKSRKERTAPSKNLSSGSSTWTWLSPSPVDMASLDGQSAQSAADEAARGLAELVGHSDQARSDRQRAARQHDEPFAEGDTMVGQPRIRVGERGVGQGPDKMREP